MIECVLLPDASYGLPAEARDHGILATHLEGANADIELNNDVVINWRDVEREVRNDRLVLRAPGSLSEFQQTALDAITGAIVNNVAGLKVHPDGWQDVEETTGP